MKIVKELLPYVIIVLIVVLFRIFIATPARVTGTSMLPTLHHKDIVIINKISYRFNNPKRFDVIELKVDNEVLVKRIIGLPGDHLKYEDDKLYINGNLIEENYERDITADFTLEDINYETIPNNMYFVLGDNRSYSQDSRFFGLISKKDIIGKSGFVIWPFKNFGTFK